MTPPTLKQILEKATPGPWLIEENMVSLEDWAVYSGRRRICRIDCWPEGDANAQLIARCSPSVMLAAVEILEDLSGYVRASTYPDGPCLKSEDLSEVNRVLNLLNGKAQ